MSQSPKRSKLKTHKAAAKRLYTSGGGQLLRLKGHRSHLRRKKPARVSRQFRDKLPIHPSDRRRVQRLLPYGTS